MRRAVGVAVALGVSLAPAVAAAQAPQPVDPSTLPPPPPMVYPYGAQPVYPQPGYPQPGVAPPGYAPAPYPYPAPVMVAPQATQPWVIDDWSDDAPAPPGWSKIDHVNTGLITAGAVLLGSGWLSSALVASVGSGNGSSNWTPLYAPVAGPLVAIGTLRPNAGGMGLLLGDAVIQGAGTVAIVAGIFDRRVTLQRVDANAPTPGGPVSEGSSARTTVLATGGVLAGLGGVAILVAGVAEIVALSSIAQLSVDCPNNVCVRGTPGGDAYIRAADAQKTAGYVSGVGVPTLAAGISLLAIGGGMRKSVRATPLAGAGVTGMKLEVDL